MKARCAVLRVAMSLRLMTSLVVEHPLRRRATQRAKKAVGRSGWEIIFMSSGLDRVFVDCGFDEVGLGVAPTQDAPHVGSPKSLHGANLIGNLLEITFCDSVPNGAHFAALIAVHSRAAIKDERNERALHFGRKFVDPRKSIFGLLTVFRERALLKDFLGVGGLDLDVAKFTSAPVRVLALETDDVFEPLDLVAAQVRAPVLLELVRRSVTKIVTGADGDAGGFAGPFAGLIDALEFKDESDRFVGDLEGHMEV